MRRRDFLATGSALAAVTLISPAALAQARAAGWRPERTLVLIELAGGNDGLNTVVPYADSAYERLRPGIAIKRDAVVQLDEQFGLHPSLARLADAWKERELAIVQGVGYENPNRSHFRSIDIWDSASGANRFISDGWVARLIGPSLRKKERLADAVVLGGGTGPVTGTGLRAVSMPDPQRFLRQAQDMRAADPVPANPALAHVIKVQREIQDTAKELREVLARAPEVRGEFPNGPLAQQLRVAARLIQANAVVPVIKIALGGFDTHANQPGVHANLLRQLGDGLAALRKSLVDAARWDRVLVIWVKTATNDTRESWSIYHEYLMRPDYAAWRYRTMDTGHEGHALWPALEVRPEDAEIVKTRFSAFIQGSSAIDAHLKARGIDTLLVAGTTTNVCCESTARDAMMLNYKVVMVHDALAAYTDAEHNATLATFYMIFGDVQSIDEVTASLERGQSRAAA